MIGLFLMFLNQFSGSFAIMVYTADIFRKSGSDLTPNESAIIVAVIQLLGVYVSTICVEKCGRKVSEVEGKYQRLFHDLLSADSHDFFMHRISCFSRRSVYLHSLEKHGRQHEQLWLAANNLFVARCLYCVTRHNCFTFCHHN
jgi:hypothetical protein